MAGWKDRFSAPGIVSEILAPSPLGRPDGRIVAARSRAAGLFLRRSGRIHDRSDRAQSLLHETFAWSAIERWPAETLRDSFTREWSRPSGERPVGFRTAHPFRRRIPDE